MKKYSPAHNWVSQDNIEKTIDELSEFLPGILKRIVENNPECDSIQKLLERFL